MSTEQREAAEKNPNARPLRYSQSENDLAVCNAIEGVSKVRKCTFQAFALAYPLTHSTYVFPIVGVQTTDHVKAMADALQIKLTEDEVKKVQARKSFKPQFPIDFLFNFKGDQDYNTRLTAAQNQQYQMSA